MPEPEVRPTTLPVGAGEMVAAVELMARTAGDAITVTDREARVLIWNPAAERLFRLPASLAVGRSIFDLTESTAIGGSDVEDPRQTTISEGSWRGRRTERARIGPNAGREVIIEVALSRLDTPDGDLVGIISIGRDVTGVVRMERELQAELVQAQKMGTLGQLVSGVAHELNNPLAAITAFSQLIRRDPSLPEELRRDADTLNDEADRTRRIVRNLLDFARQRPPERHPTRIDTLVRTVLELQAYNLSTGRIEVDVDIPSSLPTVPIDRSRLQQVLLNLTRNAMQAIAAVRDRGRIKIVARALEAGPPGGPSGPMVRLTITDDGPGVAEDHRERLFLPISSTKPPGEGSGRGLPVSFGIVAAHGGNLRFEPGPGGAGASFIVELPIAPSDSPAGGSQPARSDPDPAPGFDGTAGAETAASAPPDPASPTFAQRQGSGDGEPGVPPTVLVLDDEPSIRRLLTKVLQAAGFRAVIATTGPEAVAAVGTGGIDVVVCDHRMAGMSGIDVYEAVVALDSELADRFVFMSGDVLNPELRAFSRRHRLDLLAKPFDVDAVVTAVRTIVAERSPD